MKNDAGKPTNKNTVTNGAKLAVSYAKPPSQMRTMIYSKIQRESLARHNV